ncbi:hypothetical protein ACJQWK_00651 [Exserohilum turcicum]|uniref:ceramidase n=1 Tax=Exserohilum turcicum (strain 28A) TaxID=671987 RepID=R0K3W5_EXST2|nr:uncharacterized protein SETTUDRAFT_180291 [Exserohilum turcica Et28A]EOA84264.1 hypothetical protein SETTUDRAFT_180291 [Exserohilum turcica Et28A]
MASTNTPPIYTINLSLPPSDRYTFAAQSHAASLRQIPKLYSEATSHLGLPAWFFHLLGRILLRRLHSREHTEELRGISKACGLPMYLLIAYNVFLDLLLGCTSGGIKVKNGRPRRRGGVGEEEEEDDDDDDDDNSATMLHFRTLDWSMPLLRDLIVQFEFVEHEGGHVVARTVGYVGFVGVLTGVRKGLSVSLNFRPYHNALGSFTLSNLAYYWNTVLVVLGQRPSISALLRECLIPRPGAGGGTRPRTKLSKNKKAKQRKQEKEEKRIEIPTILPPYSTNTVLSVFPTLPTPVAYLIFCTPTETLVLEKDFRTANILRSSAFLATTNHDVAFETPSCTSTTTTANSQTRKHAFLQSSMREILDESIERKQCLSRKWEAWNQRQTRKTMRGQTAAKGVALATLRRWIEAYPVCNEVTHFACIMDPSEGVFRWVRKFEEGEIED